MVVRASCSLLYKLLAIVQIARNYTNFMRNNLVKLNGSASILRSCIIQIARYYTNFMRNNLVRAKW